MSYIAYINGQQLELSDNKPIAQTKQVNDIASLESRQSNFTNTFIAPLTANNIKAMEFLNLVGNQSNLPYQKNLFDLIDADTGLHLIYKGWANVKKTDGKGYEIYVYDGIIDFYKAIENKTLADLDLKDLEHSKTLAEVVATFDNSRPYKYILADFNGKALYDTNKINIDYLVPSVRASALVSKIEAFTGFTFNGSFKTNPDYLNLWLTYPKGTPADLGTTEVYDSVTGFVAGHGLTYSAGVGFTATEQIRVNATFFQQSFGGVALRLNGVGCGGTIIMNTGDILSTWLYNRGGNFDTGGRYFNKVLKYNSLNIDFLDELKGMTIREFFNEIIWRFGLTIFKRKYNTIYDFETIAEIIDPSNTIDWSKKFISKESEKYIFGSYAQNNYMRYKYNDDNAIYNDGFLFIDNKNLADQKTIIPSKIYSPELAFSDNLGFVSKVYKLWNKESKDDGNTAYKPLSNRFYFMRSVDKTFASPVTIGSESLANSQTIAAAPVENFTGLTFNEIIAIYYPDIKRILNKSQVLTCKFWLSTQDVNDIDFSVPYYIEQLGGSFMINKINNFIKGKETIVELIRINNL